MYRVCLGLALVLALGFGAPLHAADSAEPCDCHALTTWTTKDGLPSGNIMAMAQDREGFLWLGMNGGGLVRFDGEQPVTLGEGWTPLIHAPRLGAILGLSRLFIKDESLNPTNSFKARGLSAAITRAVHLGAKTIALPSAGNAGNAAAAYSAAAGLACEVFLPRDAKRP